MYVDEIKQGHNFLSHPTSLSHYSEDPPSHPTPKCKYPISNSLLFMIIRFLNLGFQEGDLWKPFGIPTSYGLLSIKINKINKKKTLSEDRTELINVVYYYVLFFLIAGYSELIRCCCKDVR